MRHFRKHIGRSGKTENRNRISLPSVFILKCWIIALLLFFLLLLLNTSRSFPVSSKKAESIPGIPLVKEEEHGISVQADRTGAHRIRAESTSAMPSGGVSSESSGNTAGEILTPADAASLTPDQVYTFLQGPKAWNSRTDWSGSWCELVLADQKFSVFGCGLCDLANIYSTLTAYDCSPVDMFYYAREVSGYQPVSGYGAIDWPDLKKTLQTTGIYSELGKKPDSYEEFQSRIAGSFCSIVLVSSYNDSSYWPNSEGHYVNLWLYDAGDDTVFLADSGNPDHNRQRIPLRYVYSALKTAADYQYLLVTGVNEKANAWKHDGISLQWKKPSYLH